MFYGVLALLATRQSETSLQSGAISQFDQLYVKPALLPRDFSRWLHDAFLNRQAADYGSELTLYREEMEALLAHTRDFLAAVRQYLATQGPARNLRVYLPSRSDRPSRHGTVEFTDGAVRVCDLI